MLLCFGFRTRAIGGIGAAVLCAMAGTAMAQPANDLCTGAIALTPGTPVTMSNSTATPATSGGTPDDGANSTCQTNVKAGIWFSLSTGAGGSGSWQISTCTGTTTTHDTVLTVFKAGIDCTGIATASNILVCNDDGGPWCTGANNASLTTTLASSSTYLVRVQTWGGGTTGNITLLAQQLVPTAACCNDTTGACSTIVGGTCPTGTTQTGTGTTCEPTPCPPSQSCCNGNACTIVLVSAGCATGTAGGAGSTCSPNLCFLADECATTDLIAVVGTQSGSNVGATTSFNITPGSLCPGIIASGTGGNNDVFWKFTAPATAAYTLDTCAANSFDTVLSVHDGCPATSANVVACNDDSSSTGNTACSQGTLLSRIQTVTLTGGHQYYLRVGSYLTTTFGAYSINIAYVDAAGIGSCCVGTACSLTDAANCGGSYTVGGTCASNPCGGPSGVCCRGSTCSTTVTSAGDCTGSLVGGQMAGAAFVTAAACNSSAISNTPCCYADYNKVNGVNVQDIFDFLGDWFGGSAFANTGGTGTPGTLSVQNIFDFLTNWFAGGC